MIQEEANMILHKMSKVIDNNQMVKLNTILEELMMDAKLDSQLRSSEEILEAFLSSKKLEGRSEKTLSLYRFTIEKMLEKVNKNICTVTTEDIRNYLAGYREEHNVSKATIDGIRRNLSSLYHWLEDEDYIFVSPLRKIHKIKLTKKVKAAYSDEELEKLRDGFKYLRDLAIIEFLFSTGMRIGELVKLNRNDINFEERECKVLGKGDKERLTYFDAKTKLHLQEYLAARTDDNPALFVSIRKPAKRITTGGIEIMMHRLGERCNIEKCHPHRCRRTMATTALEKGMPIEQVQRVLGHSQISTTLLYTVIKDSTIKNSHRKYIG